MFFVIMSFAELPRVQLSPVVYHALGKSSMCLNLHFKLDLAARLIVIENVKFAVFLPFELRYAKRVPDGKADGCWKPCFFKNRID